MAIKVLISREFRKDKVDEAYKLLMELRSVVTLRPGYISGQTLVNADHPNKIVVVGTWSSRKQWEEWQQGQERKEFSNKVAGLLESPERVEVFLTGTPAEW